MPAATMRHRLGGERTKQLAPVWVVVLLLHGLLAWLLLQPGSRLAETSAPLRVTLRLLPWRVPVKPPIADTPLPAGPAERVPARSVGAPRAQPEAARPTVAAPAPQTITLPPMPSASEPIRPLDLTLHPSDGMPGIRGAALSDPRANTLRTPEARMGERLGGDGSLVEENLGDGRRRYRQNDSCHESRPARAAELHPFSPIQPPNLIGDC